MRGAGHDHGWAWADAERPRWSPRARLLVPVALSALVQIPATVAVAMTMRGPGALATVLLAIAGPLVLLAARRLPGPTVAIIAVLAAADFAISTSVPGPPYLALAFAIGGAIVRGARLWAWISVDVVWVATIVIGALAGIQWHIGRIAVTTLAILVVFGLAEGLRTRREHAAGYREALRRRRQSEVQAERTRIARELHDVLAHSLSQINVQAGVGLHLMDAQPEKAKDALAAIKLSSKTALDEVRSLLGVLRADGADAPLLPEPDLAGLPALVAAAGIPVTLRADPVDASTTVQLAAYRIVQESLTNVVRHAEATRATVHVHADGEQVVIAVADDGRGVDPQLPPGRGLVGMRERAELLGGSLSVGRSDLGGALVTARIPRQERP